MPRDANGNWTNAYTQTAGQPARASAFNNQSNDLGNEITDSLSRSGKGGMQQQLQIIAGSALAPGVVPAGDTNTGMFQKAADVLGLAAGGVEIAALSTSGIASSKVLNLSAGTAHILLPKGTTGQRSTSAVEGMFRENSTNKAPEYFSGTSWISLKPVMARPMGRLTVLPSTPVIASDVAGTSAVYYTPFEGNIVPIYDGTDFVNTAFIELGLSLVASHTANSLYDVFAISPSGTAIIVTGPAWSVVAAGTSSRGTGAGTTELERVGGIWTNKVSMTARNGSTTYTVAANRGTYLGSIFTDGTNGQVTCLVGYGQSRKWSVWNAYNQRPITLLAGDNTASWTYTSATVRQANGAGGNIATTFCGLPDVDYFATYTQHALAGSGGTYLNGIGFNSNTAFGNGSLGKNEPSANTSMNCIATLQRIPTIGLNNFYLLEQSNATGAQMSGGQSACQLLVKWMG